MEAMIKLPLAQQMSPQNTILGENLSASVKFEGRITYTRLNRITSAALPKSAFAEKTETLHVHNQT
mgnify:CR=1 FL=1